jgi:hypothetical protein
MKTVVLDQQVLEWEVKPQAMLDEYRQLLAEEVTTWFSDPHRLSKCSCPGCQSDRSNVAFEKFGFTYHHCVQCKSLYVSPRPSEEALVDFYMNSKSSRFWQERILKETKETRRAKLFKPRAQWVLDIVDQYRPDARLGIVIGYHNDLLIEELMLQDKRLFELIVTNPIADIEFKDLTLSGVTIRPTPTGQLISCGPADILFAFDIFDRCTDVDALFAAARSILTANGLILASTTMISGFDLQMLWDRSESIYPPDRLNLFSTEGLSAAFERHGFEALEFSTPGMFDVEIVQRAIHDAPQDDWPRFIRYLVENRSEDALRSFQEYLQKYRLSSFGRIALRRLD